MAMPETLRQTIKPAAEADFPTRWGHFRLYGFEADLGAGSETALALRLGKLETPLVRIHSQCLTGDVFGSLRCDCRAQLELALETIAAAGNGLLIYEDKEGRGIGLINKLRAYELQDRGADTVEANEKLGLAADAREYRLPVEILRWFGIRRLRLLSNNPAKIAALTAAGIEVTERVACQPAASEHAERYLHTKRQKLGHLLEPSPAWQTASEAVMPDKK